MAVLVGIGFAFGSMKWVSIVALIPIVYRFFSCYMLKTVKSNIVEVCIWLCVVELGDSLAVTVWDNMFVLVLYIRDGDLKKRGD